MHWCSEAICLHYLCKKLPKPKKPQKMFNSFTRQNVVQEVTLSRHIKEFVASFILTSFPIKTSLYFKKINFMVVYTIAVIKFISPKTVAHFQYNYHL